MCGAGSVKFGLYRGSVLPGLVQQPLLIGNHMPRIDPVCILAAPEFHLQIPCAGSVHGSGAGERDSPRCAGRNTNIRGSLFNVLSVAAQPPDAVVCVGIGKVGAVENMNFSVLKCADNGSVRLFNLVQNAVGLTAWVAGSVVSEIPGLIPNAPIAAIGPNRAAVFCSAGQSLSL